MSAEPRERSIRNGDVTFLAPAPSTALLINMSMKENKYEICAFSYQIIKLSVFLRPSINEHEINIDKPLLFLLYTR